MTSLLQAVLGPMLPRRSSHPALSWDQFLSYFSFDGSQYPLGMSQTLTGNREEIDRTYSGYVAGAYRANAIVFACMLARFSLFSEARFQFRQLRSGRPGDLFGSSDLSVLEKPWPGGTTGDLLSRAIVDADLAGTSFLVRSFERRDRIRRLRPDWVTMVLGGEGVSTDGWDPDAELLGILYHPGGHVGGTPLAYTRDEVAVFAPIPDPLATYRGMSWLTPIVREVMGDAAATSHKLKFFENGATPNMVVKLDPAIPKEKFEEWVSIFEKKEPTNRLRAYKTLYLGGGADVTVVGKDLQQLDFKVTQGAGETRIAAAAGVGPIIAQLSEGLQGSSLNSGNYDSARRRFADLTIRPLWRNVSGSLEAIVPPPKNAQLWYDVRDIPFLAADVKDAAEVQAKDAQAIRTLVDGGFDPKSVVEAITAGDLRRLKHTGKLSVQLQPPSDTPVTNDAGRALASLTAPHLAGLLPVSTNGDHP